MSRWPSVPRAEPRAAPVRVYETRPEEPHPTPPTQRLMMTPSEDGMIGIYSIYRIKVKSWVEK